MDFWTVCKNLQTESQILRHHSHLNNLGCLRDKQRLSYRTLEHFERMIPKMHTAVAGLLYEKTTKLIDALSSNVIKDAINNNNLLFILLPLRFYQIFKKSFFTNRASPNR